MKSLKRFLSLIMCLTLLVTAVPVSAYDGPICKSIIMICQRLHRITIEICITFPKDSVENVPDGNTILRKDTIMYKKAVPA